MIYDLNGNPISSFTTAIDSGAVQVYTIRIDCRTGYSLFADAVASLTVEAKRTADADYTDIEASPIDLSAWDGTTQEFQVRLTAASVSAVTRRAFSLRVGHIA